MSDFKLKLIASLAAATATLAISSYLINKYLQDRKIRKVKKALQSETSLSSIGSMHFDKTIIEEQLSRISAFFGEEKMDIIKNAKIVVVGVGGVGSHAAHMLVRSGINNIRLIDFDQVTLSSLNRHAVANHNDVGLSKVLVLEKHLKMIAPWASIDARQELFNIEKAEALIFFENNERPDFVLDCIDNLETKVQLLKFCHSNNIKVIGSMGAGAKCDPCKVHIADISETTEDSLARATRKKLRAQGINHGIPVIFSTEKPGQTGLLPLHVEKEEAQGYAPLPTFRARILPVLGTMPAIFGMSMASYVLLQLTEWKDYKPSPVKNRDPLYAKILKKLRESEKSKYNNEIVALDIKDVAYIVEELWNGKSAYSHTTDHLCLTRYQPDQLPSKYNVILLTLEESEMHLIGELELDKSYIESVFQNERKYEDRLLKL